MLTRFASSSCCGGGTALGGSLASPYKDTFHSAWHMCTTVWYVFLTSSTASLLLLSRACVCLTPSTDMPASFSCLLSALPLVMLRVVSPWTSVSFAPSCSKENVIIVFSNYGLTCRAIHYPYPLCPLNLSHLVRKCSFQRLYPLPCLLIRLQEHQTHSFYPVNHPV